jgi:2-phosphosulfolactate phosphatase
MRIDLFFTPLNIEELQLREKNVVVVDVLRACTTIATALANGAREVIPVETVEAAVKISGGLFGDVVLLGGERGGKVIEGFHLGNSPSEYSPKVVGGKSIVFTTTNGTLAISKSRYAKRVIVGAFVNAGEVVRFLKNLDEDILFICAGNQSVPGGFSLEDAVCAGLIMSKLKLGSRNPLELSDSAVGSLTLYQNHSKNLVRMLEDSEAGRTLALIGLKSDLKACATVDAIPVLPILKGNVIRLEQGAKQTK